MSRLVILRGNSGSGKSTTAISLRREMGYQTMLIQQDVIRREILRVKGDDPGNPNVALMKQLAEYGQSIGYDVVIEGILQNSTNQAMLRGLIDRFDQSFVYYFDISFDETLRRHRSKPNAHEFGEAEMRDWWRDKDYLDVDGEKLIGSKLSQDEIVAMIMADIK